MLHIFVTTFTYKLQIAFLVSGYLTVRTRCCIPQQCRNCIRCSVVEDRNTTRNFSLTLSLGGCYPVLDGGSLVVSGLAVHSVAGSILLWGNFPVEGIFPLELTWVQTPFPQKNFFGREYKPRSSLCTHAFHRTDSKDTDVHVLGG